MWEHAFTGCGKGEKQIPRRPEALLGMTKINGLSARLNRPLKKSALQRPVQACMTKVISSRDFIDLVAPHLLS